MASRLTAHPIVRLCPSPDNPRLLRGSGTPPLSIKARRSRRNGSHTVSGFPFREEFLKELKNEWAAPFEAVDFTLRAGARQHINEASQACYWWRLLTAWARQQHEPSRTDGFSPF